MGTASLDILRDIQVIETMTIPAYPAARTIAARVQPHFARHVAALRRQGSQHIAPEPDTGMIEAVIDAAFWASLRREEGYTPKISLALVPSELAIRPLQFERRLPLDPVHLTRVAPAVERPGIHLGVWRDGGELHVWGTTRALPEFCFVLEVITPGLLVIKHSRSPESGKFVNIAVLEADQVKLLDECAAGSPECPSLLTSLLGLDSLEAADGSVNVLIQLAVSMRAHGRGGALLVVPANSEIWRESVVRPMSYSISPRHSELADLVRQGPGEASKRKWQEALRLTVDATAGLTAVDGATVINDQYELLAFGAKIKRRDGCEQVEQVILTEPIEGAIPATVAPVQFGGTRHLSAAQFAQDQHDSLALVASQDGRFTIFTWSLGENMVHAHRIETLLL
jgi:hypothetical protein